MCQELIEAGRSIAADLLDLEARIDASIASSGRLPATMVDARLRTESPAALGQDALMHAAKAFELLVQARKHVVQAHAALVTVGADMGLATTASGDNHACPPKPSAATDAQPRLRLASAS
jgi:hypothetical protein